MELTRRKRAPLSVLEEIARCPRAAWRIGAEHVDEAVYQGRRVTVAGVEVIPQYRETRGGCPLRQEGAFAIAGGGVDEDGVDAAERIIEPTFDLRYQLLLMKRMLGKFAGVPLSTWETLGCQERGSPQVAPIPRGRSLAVGRDA